MLFLMRNNLRLSIASEFYLFLGNIVSNFVTKSIIFCFPRWNLFSFGSHLVLKMNRTDRLLQRRCILGKQHVKLPSSRYLQPERRLGFSGAVHEPCQLEGCTWYQLLTGRKMSWQARYRWSKAEPWAIHHIVTCFWALPASEKHFLPNLYKWLVFGSHGMSWSICAIKWSILLTFQWLKVQSFGKRTNVFESAILHICAESLP